jgi:hypothetical protein
LLRCTVSTSYDIAWSQCHAWHSCNPSLHGTSPDSPARRSSCMNRALGITQSCPGQSFAQVCITVLCLSAANVQCCMHHHGDSLSTRCLQQSMTRNRSTASVDPEARCTNRYMAIGMHPGGAADQAGIALCIVARQITCCPAGRRDCLPVHVQLSARSSD